MKQKRGEPSALKHGKAFHKEVQAKWKRTAKGKVRCEKPVTKTSGSRGRIDIHVDAGGGLVAVVEVKSTDWTRMPESQIRRRVEEYSRQVWEYIEHELSKGADVSPGIVLVGLPNEPDRVALIERLFSKECIAVTWQDETKEEARVRHIRVT